MIKISNYMLYTKHKKKLFTFLSNLIRDKYIKSGYYFKNMKVFSSCFIELEIRDILKTKGEARREAIETFISNVEWAGNYVDIPTKDDSWEVVFD